MKKLYDKDDRYTKAAEDISFLTTNALEEAFNFYVKEGYSCREIAHVMQAAVTDLELTSVLSQPKEK